MPTQDEILKKYNENHKQNSIRRTRTEAIKYQLYGCQTCGTIDDTLRIGDVIKVLDRTSNAWNNKTGTITSFEVLFNGNVIMWFRGYFGHIIGTKIQKLCPKCLEPVHEMII